VARTSIRSLLCKLKKVEAISGNREARILCEELPNSLKKHELKPPKIFSAIMNFC
jgi:hypothetical protein